MPTIQPISQQLETLMAAEALRYPGPANVVRGALPSSQTDGPNPSPRPLPNQADFFHRRSSGIFNPPPPTPFQSVTAESSSRPVTTLHQHSSPLQNMAQPPSPPNGYSDQSDDDDDMKLLIRDIEDGSGSASEKAELVRQILEASDSMRRVPTPIGSTNKMIARPTDVSANDISSTETLATRPSPRKRRWVVDDDEPDHPNTAPSSATTTLLPDSDLPKADQVIYTLSQHGRDCVDGQTASNTFFSCLSLTTNGLPSNPMRTQLPLRSGIDRVTASCADVTRPSHTVMSPSAAIMNPKSQLARKRLDGPQKVTRDVTSELTESRAWDDSYTQSPSRSMSNASDEPSEVELPDCFTLNIPPPAILAPRKQEIRPNGPTYRLNPVKSLAALIGQDFDAWGKSDLGYQGLDALVETPYESLDEINGLQDHIYTPPVEKTQVAHEAGSASDQREGVKRAQPVAGTISTTLNGLGPPPRFFVRDCASQSSMLSRPRLSWEDRFQSSNMCFVPVSMRKSSRLQRARELGLSKQSRQHDRPGRFRWTLDKRWGRGSYDALSAAWHPHGRRFAVGFSCLENDENRDYFQDLNLVLGDIELNLVSSLPHHCTPVTYATEERTSFRPDWRFRTVNCVHFTPNGKFLLTAGRDGPIRVWDAMSQESEGTLLETIASSCPVNMIDSQILSSGRTRFACGGSDGCTRVFEERRGRFSETLAIQPPQSRQTGSHDLSVTCLQFGRYASCAQLLLIGYEKDSKIDREAAGNAMLFDLAEKVSVPTSVSTTLRAQRVFDVAWSKSSTRFMLACAIGFTKGGRLAQSELRIFELVPKAKVYGKRVRGELAIRNIGSVECDAYDINSITIW